MAPVLGSLRDGQYTLLHAESLLEELVDVLSRPRIRDKYHVADGDIESILLLILLRGEPVNPDRRIAACRDPKDDKFLEVAVAGRADAIVTADEDLLDLNPFEGIPIVGPAAFLDMLAGTGES